MKNNKERTPLRTILQNTLVHIENLETNRYSNDKYEKEFQDLKHFSEVLRNSKDFSCIEGEKEFNRKKNRYKDILPFDISRVTLTEYAGVPGSDYINANFIKGASGSPAYIASQGPLPHTVNDFWRMVVECEVQVIVMACNPEEAGKHKCENYWVEKEGEEKKFGMVEICLIKASTVCPDFLVRTMRLKYTNEKAVTEERTVCQFHYSTWPDHGVPPLVRPLLDMVRLVRDTQASETLPVLVHCSAGCGRTGTICAIDFVWGLLRAGKLREEFTLFNLIKDMRKQRIAMVQTKEQYILVHQAVRELFKEQLQVIESHPYENIDLNGLPLNEPVYDTIDVSKMCIDEKADEAVTENENKLVEEKTNYHITNCVPPLPEKKHLKTTYSKQEKDVENMTVKTSSLSAPKLKDNDSPTNSLLSKPRIAKLRALFERRSPVSRETTSKPRHSGVSRSHSLGAVKKPLLTEIVPVESHKMEKSKNQPIQPENKLKLPKPSMFVAPRDNPRPANIIRRSKSLKLVSSEILSLGKSLPEEKIKHDLSVLEAKSRLKDQKKKIENYATVRNVLKQDETLTSGSKFRRRRSLESLIGDEQNNCTWPSAQKSVSKHTSYQYSNCTPNQSKHATLPSLYHKKRDATTDSLKHHIHNLSVEAQRKMNSLVSGLAVKERRNSFRQAISSDKKEVRKGSYEYIWTDGKTKHTPTGFDDNNAMHVDVYSNTRVEKLVVKSQDGTILRPQDVAQPGRSYKKPLIKCLSEQYKSKSSDKTKKDEQLSNHSKLKQNYEQDGKTNDGLLDNYSDLKPFEQNHSTPVNYDSKNRFLRRLRSEIEGEKYRSKSLFGSQSDSSCKTSSAEGVYDDKRVRKSRLDTEIEKFKMKTPGENNTDSLTAHSLVNIQQLNDVAHNKKLITRRNDYQNVCDITSLKNFQSTSSSIASADVVDGPVIDKTSTRQSDLVKNGNSYVNVIITSPDKLKLDHVSKDSDNSQLTEADFKDHCMWIPPKVTKSYKKSKNASEGQVYLTSHDLYATVNRKTNNQFTSIEVHKQTLPSPEVVRSKVLTVPSESDSPSSHSSGDYNEISSLVRNITFTSKKKETTPRFITGRREQQSDSESYVQKKDVFYFPSVITRQEHGVFHDSESSSSSGTRELQNIMSKSVEDTKMNYGPVSRVKQNPSQLSIKTRDDLSLNQSSATSRIKRHASVMVTSRSVERPHANWKPGENTNNSDSCWSVAPGVDLDAVAASIQHSKAGVATSSQSVNRQTPTKVLDTQAVISRQTPNKLIESRSQIITPQTTPTNRQTPNKQLEPRIQVNRQTPNKLVEQRIQVNRQTPNKLVEQHQQINFTTKPLISLRKQQQYL